MDYEELEEYNEESEGPVQGDYVISTTGQLGSVYQVSIVESVPSDDARWNSFNRRAREKVVEWDNIIEAIKKDMEVTRYYPTVWHEDDHGGLTVVNLGG